MTRLIVDVRGAAEQDIAERYVWLVGEAGSDVADRMLAAVDRAIWRVAETPGIGSPVEMDHAALAGIRKWRLAGFPNLLLFYLASDTRLDVVRLLHSAQDWSPLLQPE